MRRFVSAMLIVVGIIHWLPVPGVLGAERLMSLYGISFSDPGLLLLMQHRAVLFALLGLFLVYAAFRPALQPLAFAAALVSVVSFMGLAWPPGIQSAAIRRIFLADVVALVCLVLGLAAFAHGRRKGRRPGV